MNRAAYDILRRLVALADAAPDLAEDDYEPEIVRDGRSCYLGMQRFQSKTLDELLRYTAISSVGEEAKGLERYVLNSTGRVIVARPALAGEAARALRAGRPFTITDEAIVYLD